MSGPIMALSIVMLYEQWIESRAGMLTLLTLRACASHSMQSVQLQILLTTCMNGEDLKYVQHFRRKSDKNAWEDTAKICLKEMVCDCVNWIQMILEKEPQDYWESDNEPLNSKDFCLPWTLLHELVKRNKVVRKSLARR